ncbi:DUF2721 domain-containing protein [Alteromonas oceanisediminis]|uniref:DUF2721 domain-containing protein n=1 Tax=Alteromonas oceanisediminis TaxID=2836180 RepID=UPI001BD9F382|nr:DUF2721 domain-containing protein [Alteromonas oceanisediminis]MBT0587600.1 DUF2721 domain-containing protein [Alteromonas oceanisediminis]
MEIHLTDSAVELIQLSLAPVFLLVGIGQIINVVTGRLARIIDRARWIEEHQKQTSPAQRSQQGLEMTSLRRRMRFANWSINFLTGAAVAVCVDVILLLLNGLIDTSLDVTILVTFIFGLVLITGGLIAFFLEVSLATATLKVSSSGLSD